MSTLYAYRPEIDGLRAVAVIAVVIFHAQESLLPGGYVGVDIFFVISGFLITTIIQREIQLGRFSIAGFYDRRIRRIFPSLFVVMLAGIPLGWALMTPDQLKDFFQSILATGLFLSNVYFYLKTGYFEQSAQVLPLLHTWSLAVEEQYYVFFPLLMMVLSLRRGRLLMPVLWLLLIASFALSTLWGTARPTLNFFMLPTRVWELLAGGLLALYFPVLRPWLEARKPVRHALEAIGALGVLYGIFMLTPADPFPGPYAVPVVLGTVLLIASSGPRMPVGRVLASKLAVGIGLISYSAYLWHQPAFAFTRIYLGDWSTADMIVPFFLTMALAYLSWRFVEQPFRNRNWLSTRTVLGGGVAMIVLFGAVGAVGHLRDGFPERFDAETRALAATADVSPRRAECHTDGLDYLRPADACTYGDGPTTWAVFGDSHGVELAYALGERLETAGQSLVHMTFSGCPPALNFSVANPGCQAWVNEAIAELETSNSVENVAIVYRHAFHLYGEQGPFGDDYRAMAQGDPSFMGDRTPEAARALYWQGLTEIVDRLTAAGKTVYLFTPIPELPESIDRVIYDTRRPLAERANARGASVEFFQARYGDILERLSALEGNGVRIVPLQDVLCDDQGCRATQDGTALYFDDNHLSLSGARLVVNDLVEGGLLPLGGTQ